jgi:hypothetical protein
MGTGKTIPQSWCRDCRSQGLRDTGEDDNWLLRSNVILIRIYIIYHQLKGIYKICAKEEKLFLNRIASSLYIYF